MVSHDSASPVLLWGSLGTCPLTTSGVSWAPVLPEPGRPSRGGGLFLRCVCRHRTPRVWEGAARADRAGNLAILFCVARGGVAHGPCGSLGMPGSGVGEGQQPAPPGPAPSPGAGGRLTLVADEVFQRFGPSFDFLLAHPTTSWRENASNAALHGAARAQSCPSPWVARRAGGQGQPRMGRLQGACDVRTEPPGHIHVTGRNALP